MWGRKMPLPRFPLRQLHRFDPRIASRSMPNHGHGTKRLSLLAFRARGPGAYGTCDAMARLYFPHSRALPLNCKHGIVGRLAPSGSSEQGLSAL
jgi:hypothetical protein